LISSDSENGSQVSIVYRKEVFWAKKKNRLPFAAESGPTNLYHEK
jgi:hypothetical protein